MGSGTAFRGAQASVAPSRMSVAPSRIGPTGATNGGNFANNTNFANNGNFARRGFRGDRDHDRRFRPGFGLGFVAGSVLGYGYDPYYDYAYNDYYDDDYPAYPAYVASSAADPAYCAQRYRSYDPATGTYLGYDGLRHPCE
jgi:hypothetical protein